MAQRKIFFRNCTTTHKKSQQIERLKNTDLQKKGKINVRKTYQEAKNRGNCRKAKKITKAKDHISKNTRKWVFPRTKKTTTSLAAKSKIIQIQEKKKEKEGLPLKNDRYSSQKGKGRLLRVGFAVNRAPPEKSWVSIGKATSVIVGKF